MHCKSHTLTTAPWPKGAKDLYMVFYQSTYTKLSEAASKSTLASTTDRLPPHHVVTMRPSLKRKQVNDCYSFAPSAKKVCSKVVHGNTTVKGKSECELAAVHHATAVDCVVTGYDMAVARTEWPEYRYYPVDEHWQRQACTLLGLRVIRPFQHMSGGPDVILTRPDDTSLRNVGADGNCLFRSLCYVITGSEAQHYELRSELISYMLSIPELLCGIGADGHRNYLEEYGGYESVENYLSETSMAVNGT